jgi:hypothetical protein
VKKPKAGKAGKAKKLITFIFSIIIQKKMNFRNDSNILTTLSKFLGTFYEFKGVQHNNTTTTQQMSDTNASEQAILVAVQELISEHNNKIEKTIAKLNNDLLLKIGNLMNPTLTVPKPTRTRTITPVSEDEKCTTVLVSGKNKGGRCSKKATNGSLCTMHHKKTEPIHSTLSEEFVQSDDDVSNTPRVSVV